MSKHKGGTLRRCTCRSCRAGARNDDHELVQAKRKFRRKVKELIHAGKYDQIPDKIGVPYTD